ncbi:MAG TPA: tandem-95 repeat protein, partial [Thermoplasmatales archaeon]|nr:tandem-95 repeat protein [Thermoplasmatales archaeon]
DIDNSTLSAVLLHSVTHGNLTLYSNGSFIYTPDNSFIGNDSFTYQAYDGVNYSNIATVNITVVDVNDIPVANNDSYTINEDSILNISAPGVLGNDVDYDNGPSPLTAVLVTNVVHGTLTLNSDGSFTYTPDANYNGYDSFTYQAYDGANYSNIATVNITINSVNDIPIANNDSYSTNEDTTLNIVAPGVLGNDSDGDGPNTLTAILITDVSHGYLTFYTNGSFSYTPFSNYNGYDSFTYQAYDGANFSNIATVNITVNAVNDPPVANDDFYDTFENSILNVPAPGVLSNDTDVDSGSLSAYLVEDVTHGTLTLNSDGSFTYTPDTDYYGLDLFRYNVSDGIDYSNTATVLIRVLSTNIPPTGVNDSYTTNKGTILNIPAPGVLDNDNDTDGPNPLTAILIDDVSHGNLVFYSNGSFIYTPDPDYFGYDWFSYQAFDGLDTSNLTFVNITIINVNIPPVANNDTASTTMNTPVDIDVTNNDYDIDGSIDVTTVTIITDTTHGTTTINTTTGIVTYTPDTGYTGSDSFTYTVNDNQGATSNIATVTINIISGEQLDQQQTTYNKDLSLYGTRWAAQSFTPTLETLTKIELYIKKTGSPSENLELLVRENSIDGPTIASITLPPTAISTSYQWIEFDITDTTVTPGNNYYIILHTNGGSASNSYYWAFSSTNTYTNGSLWFSSNSGTTWNQYTQYDTCFKTYGLT